MGEGASRSGLVFEDELNDMTGVAKEVLLTEDLSFRLQGDAIFTEVPYFGLRTDIVTVRYKPHDLARRKRALGHYTPMPDERKYRRSFRRIQQTEPITENEWIHDDNSYIEQTSRQTWNWLVEHGYVRPLDPAEYGGQLSIDSWGDDDMDIAHDFHEDVPAVTVKYPDVLSITAWELKQLDWQTALRQVIRADCYADYRCVLLDKGQSESAVENKSEFYDAGVGLYLLDRSEIERVVHPDRGPSPDTATRQMLNERAVARLPDSVVEEVEEYV